MNTELCLPSHIYQTKPTKPNQINQSINQPTNLSTKGLTEGRDLRKSAIRRPSACLAIPALTASLGLIKDTLNPNCDCAYANEFPVAFEDLNVDILRATAQGKIGFCEEA